MVVKTIINPANGKIIGKDINQITALLTGRCKAPGR
ncbi:hypothetical protein SESI111939_07180 [Serratia silvae]